jgi:dTDP-4-dehydrorhamnose 3,5-epimerase
MVIEPTAVSGAYIVELEKHYDERGYFARSWDSREFESLGLDSSLAQCSVSYNRKRGTLRGMHYQVPPAAESKLVRCTRGALFDVALDLRPHSSTFLKWVGLELTPGNGRMLYIPKGVAHGFITLADDTEIFYQISEFHAPELSRGVRWNDPLYSINWPEPVTVISARDRNYPDSVATNFVELSSLVEQS